MIQRLFIATLTVGSMAMLAIAAAAPLDWGG